MINLLEEAKRVQQIAVSTYPPGEHLAAIFKNGSVRQTMHYFNPKDIAPTIRDKFGVLLYLYTVQTVEAILDKEAREEAKQRHGIALDQSERSLYGTIKRR